MEVRCSRCYSTKLCNNIPVISPHSHPTVGSVNAPVGIIDPKTGSFKQLKCDVCKDCGQVIRYHT